MNNERLVLKRVPQSSDVESAISTAQSIFEELRDEIQEVVDNAEGGLAETQRIQTLGETAETLGEIVDDSIDLPEPPLNENDLFMGNASWTENQRKGISRSDRRDNGVNILDAVFSEIEAAIERADTRLEDLADEEKDEEDEKKKEKLETLKDEIESYKSDLESALEQVGTWQDHAQSVEFPGRGG